MGLEIRHPALSEPILMPFRPAGAITVDMILSLIERIAQSKIALTFGETLTINAIIVRNCVGGGNRKCREDVANADEFIKSNSGHGRPLITVKNYCRLLNLKITLDS